jgi:outer membrane lipoprotein-sorting protein
MTPLSLRHLFLTCTVLAAAAIASAQEPAIIAKARSFVGKETALNAVTSVHFIGTLVTADPATPTKQARAAVEIFFQAPERQRIQATSEKTIEVTALDGYDAWQRVQDNTDAKNWRQTLLGADQIKRLRANTWESLGFYRGIEKHGGRIEEQGTMTVDGIACAKVAFIYAPSIIFYRYIDQATGRLVSTETESGSTLREQGEIISSGVRFPKTIVTTTKNPAGQIQTVTLTFEKITVNEPMPASLFAVPPVAVK